MTSFKLPTLLQGRPRALLRPTLIACMLALAGSVFAPAWSDSEGAPTTRLLIVSGLGGDPKFSDAFYAWSVSLMESAAASGLSADQITYLAEDPDRASEILAKSSKTEVQNQILRLREASGDQDLTWIVLIGHGSFREGLSRINLPGPDMTDQDFSASLGGFKGKVVFVNTASASGGFLRSLAGENRVVVTATKTPAQRNESVFGGKFVAAFAENLADGDQNGRVSALEAFVYARQEVGRHYESKNLLVTEQALLDDDGDGQGSDSPTALGGEGANGDGVLASRLDLAAPGAAAGSGETATRRAALQDRLDALRRQKGELAEDVYETELENLLIEIATIDRQLRQEAEEEPPR